MDNMELPIFLEIAALVLKLGILVDKICSYYDQKGSNGILFSLLSSLEVYALRNANLQSKEIFSAFNLDNINNKKSMTALNNQIITQFEIFKMSFAMYQKDHGRYQFPKDLSKADIIALLLLWACLVPKDKQKYYVGLVKVLNDNFEDCFMKHYEG